MVNPVRNIIYPTGYSKISNGVNPVRKFRRNFNLLSNNLFFFFVRFKLVLKEGIFSNGVKKLTLAILLLLSLETFLFAAEPLKLKTDESAVNFILSDLENKQVSLSDFKDRPVILFFWTTWCPFCRSELKMLKNIYERLLKDGLELLAINAGETFSKVDNFTKSYHLPFRVLLDKDITVAYAYKVLGVPTYVFINKKGHIVSSAHYFNQETYKELISE